jgi:hypothetical protein
MMGGFGCKWGSTGDAENCVMRLQLHILTPTGTHVKTQHVTTIM